MFDLCGIATWPRADVSRRVSEGPERRSHLSSINMFDQKRNSTPIIIIIIIIIITPCSIAGVGCVE